MCILQILRSAQSPTPTALDASVVPVHGAVDGMGTTLKLCLAPHAEGLLQGCSQHRLVRLDGQHIVGLLRPEVPGRLLLATEGLDGDRGPRQVQQGQDFGDGGDFMGLGRHRRRR